MKLAPSMTDIVRLADHFLGSAGSLFRRILAAVRLFRGMNERVRRAFTREAV
jgi:hypothetical protein